MCECDCWTIRKADSQRSDAFELWCWRRLLRVPLDCKEIIPVNPVMEINTEYPLDDLLLKPKCQYFGHMIWKADSLEKTLMLGKTEGEMRKGQESIRWLGSITYSMDTNLSKLRETVQDRGAWCACYSPWVCKVLDTNWWLTNNRDHFLNLILGDRLKNIAAILFRRIFCPCFPVEV